MSEILQALEQRAQASEPALMGMLTQLLTFPRVNDGVVPDSWGPNNHAEIKRVSTDTDTVFVLDSRVRSALNR